MARLQPQTHECFSVLVLIKDISHFLKQNFNSLVYVNNRENMHIEAFQNSITGKVHWINSIHRKVIDSTLVGRTRNYFFQVVSLTGLYLSQHINHPSKPMQPMEKTKTKSAHILIVLIVPLSLKNPWRVVNYIVEAYFCFQI